MPILLLLALLISFNTYAQQVESPSNKYSFDSDNPENIKARDKKIQKYLKVDKPVTDNLDFKAPVVNYDKEKNVINGSGGVFVSKEAAQVQAERGSVNLATYDAEFSGDVLFSWPQGSISSQQANVNIENEVGTFKDLELVFEEGEYTASADEMQKTTDFDFNFKDVLFSTCHCEDGSKPWKLSCNSAEVTVGDYAHAYGTTFDFYGVPLFYSPYFVFPVNVERKSGLLTPTMGFGNQDGVTFSIPLFLAISDSSDLTLTPFVATQTRVGNEFDYRQIFSSRSTLNTRLIVSDESKRGDNLRGTNTSDLDDPYFDTNRAGGFIQQRWANGNKELPVSVLSDIHLVSDDLFLREFDDSQIGLRNSRFTTSQVDLRSNLLPNLYAELSAEHNQAITVVNDVPAGKGDDYIFQRYPELKLVGNKNFKPFGTNPFGLKLQTALGWDSVNFQRQTGYEGWRHNLSPKVSIPYRFKNYLNGSFDATLNDTMYALSTEEDPRDPNDPKTDDARSIPILGAKIGTAFEKAYNPSSTMKLLTGLGQSNTDRLQRIKNVIEPQVKYTYIPDVDQTKTPFFDSLDRISETNIVTYGFTSSWIGRFRDTNSAVGDIVDIAPRIKDLPTISPNGQVSDFGAFAPESLSRASYSSGALREIGNFSVRQGYSMLTQTDPDDRDFTDVAVGGGLYPSKYFGLNADSNINVEDSEFSSWSLGNHWRDDRGDVLRLRYNFVDQSFSQVEGSFELAINSRFRAAYYARYGKGGTSSENYKEQENDFLENRIALRLLGGCNCWHIDLGYRELINPDQQQVLLNFTFNGLGDLSQGMSLIRNNQTTQQAN